MACNQETYLGRESWPESASAVERVTGRTTAAMAEDLDALSVEGLVNRVLGHLKPNGNELEPNRLVVNTRLLFQAPHGTSAATREHVKKVFCQNFLLKLHPDKHRIEKEDPLFAKAAEAFMLVKKAHVALTVCSAHRTRSS